MHGSSRRRVLGPGLLLLVASLTACDPGPDPALSSAVGDALSAARTAQLGLGLDADGRILPTTQRVVLGDMAEALADAARELELEQTPDPVDAAYRADALRATRAAVDALHAAQAGDADAADALADAADALAGLEARG